jgi:ADP-ribose diphosphatase
MARCIEIIKAETGYRGFFELRRYRLRHSLHAGGMGPELTRERVERLRAVAVLPYDPSLDQVVLVEQFRIGALEQGEGAWLLEIPGGMHESGLTPEEVACREAWEEAGCRVLELIPIQGVWISPGTASERVMLYCGRVDAGSAGGLHGLADEGEDCRAVVLDLAEARTALEQGRIDTATTVIALQWLLLHRDRVQTRWAEATTKLPPSCCSPPSAASGGYRGLMGRDWRALKAANISLIFCSFLRRLELVGSSAMRSRRINRLLSTPGILQWRR